MLTVKRENHRKLLGPVGIFRHVPNSYANATTSCDSRGAIDVQLARTQHGVYRDALARMGFQCVVIPAEHASPDSVFIEDVATVAGGSLLVHHSGHPGRRCERDGFEEAVLRNEQLELDVSRMTAPASADGGDVLRIGETLFVGLSARTNEAGADRLKAVFGPLGFDVRRVELPVDVLHLKCVCSMAGPEHLLLAQGSLDPALFRGLASVIQVPEAESYAANVVGRAGKVIVAEGFPETHRRLEEHGFEVWPIDTSEFRKGDGSLTCLSILVDGT